jgi:hypothetical protein
VNVLHRHHKVSGLDLGGARLIPGKLERLARKVFEAVPIHPSLLTNDYDYIFNFLRMNLLRAHEDFLARVDRNARWEAQQRGMCSRVGRESDATSRPQC